MLGYSEVRSSVPVTMTKQGLFVLCSNWIDLILDFCFLFSANYNNISNYIVLDFLIDRCYPRNPTEPQMVIRSWIFIQWSKEKRQNVQQMVLKTEN